MISVSVFGKMSSIKRPASPGEKATLLNGNRASVLSEKSPQTAIEKRPRKLQTTRQKPELKEPVKPHIESKLPRPVLATVNYATVGAGKMVLQPTIATARAAGRALNMSPKEARVGPPLSFREKTENWFEALRETPQILTDKRMTIVGVRQQRDYNRKLSAFNQQEANKRASQIQKGNGN